PGAAPASSLPDTDPAVAGIDTHALAYVMYTSGSTGMPKGVMVEHRNIVRLAVDSGFAPLEHGDRVAHCANPAFDAATWELWAPLLNGASVLVFDQDTLLDPARFNRALADGGVTALWLTAGLFHEYADALEAAFGGLRWLLAGGDVLDPQVVARVMGKAHPPRHLLNGYGPTETTTFATTHAVTGAPHEARAIPIGRPIGNTQVYLLDPLGQPVPVGVPGEIHIGGDGVARGYLNLPQHSAERFIADPFSAQPGARLYRTGDLARWSRHGNMEVLGRIDNQVKLRGYRIELGEIEAVLGDQAGVRQAVVICREDRPGDKRLVAYLLSQPGQVLQAAALRDAIAPQLPDYMLPSAYVMLEHLPMTPNGKVDRNALPVPDIEAAPGHSYVAPRNGDEEILCGLWQEVLGLERVGIEDNFFKLGGHSLLATQLVMRAQKAFGGELSLRLLFEAPTVAAFGAALMRNRLDSVDAGDLASMLDQLEGLSDDNIEALLGGALENT
ncbi:MAG: non-ribosomal peptide synthetase, partial [Janthinobacterium sp.]